MPSFWFPYALLPSGWTANVRVETTQGKIAAVTTTADPPGAAKIPGVALPGIPNLHSHAFQRGMAGLTETRGPDADSFWTWRELMYRFLARLGPDEIEAIAAYAYMRMLESGFTTVGEFHYLHHDPAGRSYADPGELAARIIAAAQTAGIGLTLLPCFYRYGGFGSASPTEGQRRFITTPEEFAQLTDAAQHHLQTFPGSVLGIAPHSLRAVSPDDLRTILAAFPSGPVHIHAAEQTAEVEAAQAALGAPPVAWLITEAGLDLRWCVIHATHMRPAETEALAHSNAVAGLCPITEANLGDGIFPAASFVAAGGRFGIGSDSNVITDPAAELGQLETSQRLARQARNVLAASPGASTGRSLISAALTGGAQALAQPIGAIARGCHADIVVLDADHPDLVGRKDDAWLDTWIFAAPTSLVRDVICRGKHVVEHGRHVAADAITRRWRDAIKRVLDT